MKTTTGSDRNSSRWTRGRVALLAATLTMIIGTIMISLTPRRSSATDFRYLGQKRPGRTPEIFAHGIVSTDDAVEFSPAFSPDGRELYFTRLSPANRTCHLMVMRYEDGRWTGPEIASFSGKYMTAEPSFSGNGTILYFSSKRPANGGKESIAGDIWMMRRSGRHWGRPVRLPGPVNTEVREGNPCVSGRGNLFFHRGGSDADIYVARRSGDGFAEPERLGCAINTKDRVEVEPLVAPDESFLIFYSCGRKDRIARSEGAGDLYISFRTTDGSWTDATVMDRGISTVEEENWPALSPDGKYLFFSSSRAGMPGIYWVDAAVIDEFR